MPLALAVAPVGSWPRAVAAALLATACQAPPSPAPDSPFRWQVGTWEGERIDGSGGARAPMLVVVQPALGGAAIFEDLVVMHPAGAYRGASLQAYDRAAGRWTRQYVNDVKGTFVQHDGDSAGDGTGAHSTWVVAGGAAPRQSRLVSERVHADRWIRTMHVSTDGGTTWGVLWRDELDRR